MPIRTPFTGHVTHPSQHPALLADDDASRLGADEQRHGDLPGGLFALGALRLHHAAMHQLLGARWDRWVGEPKKNGMCWVIGMG